MKLTRYPILKLLIPYVFGIFSSYFCRFPDFQPHFWIISISSILLLSIIISTKAKYNWQYLASYLLLISSFFLGIFLTKFHLYPSSHEIREKMLTHNRYWDITLCEPPIEKEKSIKATASIHETLQGETCREKVILYFQKNDASAQLECGDRLLVNASLSVVPRPNNPYAFDYQRFLQKKGIYRTAFVAANAWKKIDNHLTVRQIANHLQQFFQHKFSEAGLVGDEYAIITAILLGNDDTMEPELKASYASAGVSHILCVSGMHVGIIFMILNFLLKPLDYMPRIRILKSLLLLTFIWFYANLTGLSPSVKRAALMFTFVSVGDMLKRNTDIFHSLFASLSILLIINPLLLFEVGLQLSYAAVFGIVIFQKRLSALWTPKTKIGNYFWGLATVSVAAQLATFPLSVYYFNQFPNYFIISNLSVISLSFLVVVSGIVTLCFSFWSPLCNLCGTLLCYEIKIMNRIIKFIDALPYSLTENIAWNWQQVVVTYLLIISLHLFFTRRKAAFLIISNAMLLCFIIIDDIHKIIVTNKDGITVYSINKRSAIGFSRHGQGILLSDSLFYENDKSYNYSIKSHCLKEKIDYKNITYEQDTMTNYLKKSRNSIYFCGKKLFLLTKGKKLMPSNNKLEVDYLIVSGDPPTSPEKVCQSIHFKTVIVDDRNSNYRTKGWRDWCRENNTDFHSTKENGYWQIML